MTAELVPYPTDLPASAGMLVSWAKAADAAFTLGSALCKTSFVPAQFKDKAGEATAAILYGAEAGLSPLAALQGVYVISGKPAMYARTLLAVALGAGHEVWTEEITDTRAIVCGRRRGSDNIERSTWTIDRAKRAGYTKNAKYQSDPQAMLLARAQSDVCRRVAPDALLGMPYSVEELEDEDVPTVTIARADAKPKPVRRALAPTPIEPSLDNDSQDEQPARPVEDREDVRVFITDPQSKKLHAALNSGGYTDRALGLAFISDTVGRDVDSSKNLTREEASRVIDALEHAARPAEPPLDEEWPTTAQPGGAE
jgi:hypothetical protein